MNGGDWKVGHCGFDEVRKVLGWAINTHQLSGKTCQVGVMSGCRCLEVEFLDVKRLEVNMRHRAREA